MTFIVCMFLIGAALIVAEVMFPSFGLLGLLSATAFLLAVLEAFELGDTQGWVAVGALLVVVPGAVWTGFTVLQNSSFGTRLILKGPEHDEVSGAGADRSLGTLVGRDGLAESPLRPGGIAVIDERRIDAVSNGEFIDAGTAIVVVHVEGNRVVVAPREDGPVNETPDNDEERH